MKRTYVTLALFVAATMVFGQTAGVVEFMKGTVSIARDGKVTKKIGIGDKILFNDSISTSAKSESLKMF